MIARRRLTRSGRLKDQRDGCGAGCEKNRLTGVGRGVQEMQKSGFARSGIGVVDGERLCRGFGDDVANHFALQQGGAAAFCKTVQQVRLAAAGRAENRKPAAGPFLHSLDPGECFGIRVRLEKIVRFINLV